jgi:vancomycin resistance protein YoaR
MRADAALSQTRQTRPDLDARRQAKARAARLRRRILIGTVALLVALALGVGIGFAGSTDRIADGVKIAGVDVSGMTAEEARAALEKQAAEVAAQPVTFTAAGETFSIRPRKIGISTDWDAAIEDALGKGGGFILFRGFSRIALQISGANVEPSVTSREQSLTKQIERFAAAIDQAPKEASIVLDGYSPRVVPGRTGIELDRPAAAQVVLAALSGLERGEPVALPTRITEPEVRAPALAPVAAQVRTALSAPVRLSFRKTSVTVTPKRLATMLVLPSGGETELAIGGEAAAKYFAGLRKALDREPQNARFTLNSNGKVRIVPAKDGRTFDVQATETALLTAALSPTVRRGDLVVATATPKITTEKAKGMGITGVVGSYTTTYGGDANRLHNVQLVSRLVDDHLIAPGQVFSFNETTGERNADAGFLEAPVIINGELETGIGGGVCQVSTTVFNAAFEAGLSIEERTNHALFISHYPTGRDATVDYPSLDLKFKNDTGHWLWIRTFVGSSSLTVNLYGTPVDRRVEFETSPLEVTGPIPVEKVDDPDLYVGEKFVEDSGEPSRSVSVRRIVYDKNGKVLYDTTWNSRYVAEPKIVHIGTKERPVETPPPETEAGGQGDAQAGGGGTDTGAGAGGSGETDAGAGETSGGQTGGGQTSGGDTGPADTTSGAEASPVTIG